MTTGAHTRTARLLLALALPSHLLFLGATKLVNPNFYFTGMFLACYMTVALIQVAVLLQLAFNFVHWLWKIGVDPDSSAIPFLTAFADLIGSVLLATAFVILFHGGDVNAFDEPMIADHDHLVTPAPSVLNETSTLLSF